MYLNQLCKRICHGSKILDNNTQLCSYTKLFSLFSLIIFQSNRSSNRKPSSLTLKPLSLPWTGFQSIKNRLKTDRLPAKEAKKLTSLHFADAPTENIWQRVRKKGLSVLHKGVLTWHMGSNCDLLVTRQCCWCQMSLYLGMDFIFFEVQLSLPVMFKRYERGWQRRVTWLTRVCWNLLSRQYLLSKAANEVKSGCEMNLLPSACITFERWENLMKPHYKTSYMSRDIAVVLMHIS